MIDNRFSIVHLGLVIVKYLDNNLNYINYVSDRSQEILDIWNRQIAEENKNLFDGKLLNYSYSEVQSDDSIHVYGFYVNYKEYIAQRVNPNLDFNIKPVGVTAVTYCNENFKQKFLFGVRSNSVTQYPGMFELIPSGGVDDTFLNADRTVRINDNLIQEYEEEVSIKENQLAKIESFALIYDGVEEIYDVIFAVELQNQNARYNSEYASVFFVADNDIKEFISSNKDSIVPSSIAALQAYSKVYNKIIL